MQVDTEEFQGKWRLHSIIEDLWKSEHYQAVHNDLRKRLFPERERLATRTDRLQDVAAAAMRKDVADRSRPVLSPTQIPAAMSFI